MAVSEKRWKKRSLNSYFSVMYLQLYIFLGADSIKVVLLAPFLRSCYICIGIDLSEENIHDCTHNLCGPQPVRQNHVYT